MLQTRFKRAINAVHLMSMFEQMAKASILLILLFLGLLACQRSNSSATLLEQTFDSLEVYSIHRDSYNLDSLKSLCLELMEGDNDVSSEYEMIQFALQSVDKHSFLSRKDEQKSLLSGDRELIREAFPFRASLLENKYAYVELKGFMAVDSTTADNYVDSLQRLLISYYKNDPKGWIIDLRDNSGGNPYAMLAGLGPIIGEGIKAYSIMYDGSRHDYFYMMWNDSIAEHEYIRLSDSAYHFESTIPTAVLIGENTASAAEILTLAFMHNEETVTIGDSTFGVSTSLYPCYLADSSCIYITSGIDHDRYGNEYGGKIHPFIHEKDPVRIFERSYQWIEENTISETKTWKVYTH